MVQLTVTGVRPRRALLLFWQIIIPGASFLGHVAGVVAGQLWVGGQLSALTLPRATIVWVEASPRARLVSSARGFIPWPGTQLPYSMSDLHPVGASSNAGGASSWWPAGWWPSGGSAAGGSTGAGAAPALPWGWGPPGGAFAHLFTSTPPAGGAPLDTRVRPPPGYPTVPGASGIGSSSSGGLAHSAGPSSTQNTALHVRAGAGDEGAKVWGQQARYGAGGAGEGGGGSGSSGGTFRGEAHVVGGECCYHWLVERF